MLIIHVSAPFHCNRAKKRYVSKCQQTYLFFMHYYFVLYSLFNGNYYVVCYCAFREFNYIVTLL